MIPAAAWSPYPLGILPPLVFDRINSLQRVLILATFASVGIELTQFLSRQFGSYRYVDINDVILKSKGHVKSKIW